MTSQNPSRARRSPAPKRKRSKTPLYVAVGILLIMGLGAFVGFLRDHVEERAAHDMANPVAATPENLAAARQNYDSHCASCHGATGNGKGDKAQGLWRAPTDFRNAARMNHRTDGDFYWVTTKGNWPMPAFEIKLTDLERWQLAAYIRTFSTQSSSAPPQN